MSDRLRVSFAGVDLPNPVILASATPGWDGKHLKQAAQAGAGAVIGKTIGPPLAWAGHPRNGRLAFIYADKKRIGQVNCELFTTKSKEDWLTHDLAVAREGGACIMASILALPDPRETAALAREVEATGCADILELNVSCPMPASTVGMHIGKDPAKTAAQVAAVKGASSLPLSVKMTPNISDIAAVAVACQDARADALTISNSVRSFAGVDIYTGRPILAAFGGYTGPAIKPIIQRLVIEAARACRLPICAVGGISRWQDVVEYIMIGATAVQVCTLVMWNGYQAIPQLLRGLERFMEEQGYTSLDQMRGITLPYVTTVEEMARQPLRVAAVDRERCNDCGLCVRSCFYDALTLTRGRLEVGEANCDGCGLCTLVCPVGAMSLREPA